LELRKFPARSISPSSSQGMRCWLIDCCFTSEA
jgi:hypothetical protein